MFILLIFSFMFLSLVNADARVNVPALGSEPVLEAKPVRLMGEFVIKGREGEPVPSFTLYFDGNVLHSNSSGDYTITLSAEDVAAGRLDNFSLMICKRIDLDFEQGHTIAGIKMKKLEKCSWYKLDREWDPNEKRYYWIITHQPIEEDSCVPDKCLVVLMSNQNVYEVADTAHLATNTAVVDGVLPTIFLNDDGESLVRGSVKGAIESITWRQHTAPQKVETLVTTNGVECRRIVF